MLSIIFYRLILVMTLSFSSMAAHAAIIDNNTYLTDTTTGLDWLDLTATIGMTFDEITSSQSTGNLVGWELASASQLNQLIYNSTGVDASYQYGYYANTYGDSLLVLQTTLGLTSISEGNDGTNSVTSYYSQGYLLGDSGWLSGYYLATMSTNSQVNEPTSGVLSLFKTATYRGNFTYPAYLVRDSQISPVPEPDTSAMLLMGAGVMGFMARRRKQVAA